MFLYDCTVLLGLYCFCLALLLFWLQCCLVVMLSDGNLVGRECDWSGFVVGWDCGLVGMWSWDGILFVMVRMCFAWSVFGDQWFWGIDFCLTRMAIRF